MSDVDPTYANGEQWFTPPGGVLDGTDFEIAKRYIDGTRADRDFDARNPRELTPGELTPESQAARESIQKQMDDLLDSQEERLRAGDADLAARLTHSFEREVDELNRGERTTVTGQAHLFEERMRKVGHIYAVRRPDGPVSSDS
jgi:hypothetical protein